MMWTPPVVVWLALEPARISKMARAATRKIVGVAKDFVISDTTLLEIATIEKKGRIQLNASLEGFSRRLEADSSFCRSLAKSA